MTTMLVIEQTLDVRQCLCAAVPSDWRVLEAADGLTGLDLVRQHLPHLDLILLAMDLPDLEGHVVCLRIRALSTTIPILPLTEASHRLPLLAELGCLPALIKPVRFSTLPQTLQTALHQPRNVLPSSAVLAWAHEQSGTLEQSARHTRRITRVAVFASAPIKRAGMARMLKLSAEPFEAATATALRTLVMRGRWTAIIADAADHAEVCQLARSSNIPLILIAATLEQSYALQLADVTVVVVESDQMVAVRLAMVIEALANGEPCHAFASAPGAVPTSRWLLPPLMARRFAETPLSPREQEVVWLDSQGLSTAQIALALKITTQTVSSHWKGAQRKVPLWRSALRAWVQTLLSSQEVQAEETLEERHLGR